MNTMSNRWIVFFLMLPHLGIYFFTHGPLKPLMFIYQFAVVLVAALVLFRSLTTFNLLLILYSMIITASAAINGNLTPQIIFSIGISLGIVIYLNHAARTNYTELITGLYYLFGAAVVINLFSMIAPGGVSRTAFGETIYLLGGKNAIAVSAIPAICIAYLYSLKVHQKLKPFPLIIVSISVISCYLSASGTGFVAALLATAFIILPKRYVPSFKTLFAIYICSFFTIVIFRLHEVLFGDFIRNVLHKDSTMTGRTYVWDFVIDRIKDSWFLGYGQGQTIIYNHFFFFNAVHDGVLQILFTSGYLGLFFFAVILILAGKKLSRHKGNILANTLSFCVFIFLIVSLSESVFDAMEFLLLLILAYRIEYVINEGVNVVAQDLSQPLVASKRPISIWR